MDDRTPILRVRPADIAPLVLVCGDPARAKAIADHMEGAELVAGWREYYTYTGYYHGVRMTAASHGIGGSGAAICFEELIRSGARILVRVGTCGSYVPTLRAGSIIIAHAATREDGVTPQLVPLEYPAVADLDIISTLKRIAGARADVQLGAGIIRSQAAFYTHLLPDNHQLWIDAGVVGVEMEYATLLVIASLRGVRAGGLFVVDGNPAEDQDMTSYNPHREQVEQAKEKAIAIALDALAALANANVA